MVAADTSVFLGGSLVAAFVGGLIALFAPCCISVMLPAYLATSFQNRRVLVAMSLVFAAGVATVILPLALGAQVLRRLFVGGHEVVYAIGALLMIGMGMFALLGGQFHIPTPSRRGGTGVGIAGVYSLGLFSGITSACCAPVLAGVIALSGVASSFVAALALGLAYVAGMVAPLFAIALWWERRDWTASRLFRSRTYSWRIGSFRRTISGANLATGVLLLAMGVWTLRVAAAGPNMGAGGSGFAARVQHIGKLVTDATGWLPNWGAGLLLLAVLVLLVKRAFSQTSNRRRDIADEPTNQEDPYDHEHS
ncbi:MAG: cytochrome c biogenesis CcdA family protein [Actinomycetota bacterium]